ncbi:MAG: hypothetical protein R2706_11925 [Acidimicrobiales bacterium]
MQNFLPKPGTAMWRHEPCPEEAYLRAIALARLILPATVHLQALPNLSDRFETLLDAGIDDWGGVSRSRPTTSIPSARGLTSTSSANEPRMLI